MATTTWDPDGAGPLAPHLVVAGSFTRAGNVQANNIALYDYATGVWSALGSGTNGSIGAVLARADGTLAIGGSFTSAGNVTVNAVARWNGTAWSGFGSGMFAGSIPPMVNALAELPTGDLVAAGYFTRAGSTTASCIARWNGVTWFTLGAGLNGQTQTLIRLANGDLLAGGAFQNSGASVLNYVARWNGSAWSSFGLGVSSTVYSALELANGDIVIGGDFEYTSNSATTLNHVARWNGSSWLPLGAGMPGSSINVSEVIQLANGDLVAAGNFYLAGSASVPGIARWDGTGWSALANAPSEVRAMFFLPSGELGCAGGSGDNPGGDIARWNGSRWLPLNSNTAAGTVLAVATSSTGEVVVGGQFWAIGGAESANVALRTSQGWSALGSGTDGPVRSATFLANGNIVIGGDFTHAGGVPANRIAMWNGTSWTPLGAGCNGSVLGLAALPNGDLVACGSFIGAGTSSVNRIARWNGSAWSALGYGLGDTARCLAVLPDGRVVVGGRFTNASGVSAPAIASWNGTSWAGLGSGLTGTTWFGQTTEVTSLAVLTNGDLVAGGNFTTAGGVAARAVARWNGSSWSSLGSGLSNMFGGQALALATVPGGVVVGGDFNVAGGVPAERIARWNGQGWSAFGAGMDANVNALALSANGTLLAGGAFNTAAGVLSPRFAEFVSTCPATATPFGTGCTLQLAADELPWIGGRLRSTTTGLGATSLAAIVLGFTSPGVPLSSLHPAGDPACDLLASTETATLGLPTNGRVTASFGMPVSPVFVGVQLRQQTIELELDPASTVTSVRGSNGLLSTIGQF